MTSTPAQRIEAYGTMDDPRRSYASKPWRKSFASQVAFDKWFEKNIDRVVVHGMRKIEE